MFQLIVAINPVKLVKDQVKMIVYHVIVLNFTTVQIIHV